LLALASGVVPIHGDNAIYLYMAKIFADGVIPYRDFFFAHPPLLIFPTALIYKIFGAGIGTGIIQPAVAGIAILFSVYLIGERHKRYAGLIAAVLLLSSPFFEYTTYFTVGAALNLAFIMAAAYYSLEKKPYCAGIMLGLAALVRYSTFPVMIVIFAYNIYKKQYKVVHGALTIAPVFVLLAFVPNFVENTVLYHIGKGATVFGFKYGFFQLFWHEMPLFLIAMLSMAYFAFKKDKELAVLCSLAVASSLLGYFLISEVYFWYVMYIVPFFCILGGMLFADLWNREGKRNEAYKMGLAIILVAAVAVGFWTYFNTVWFKEADVYSGFYDSFDLRPGQVIFDTSSPMGPYFALSRDLRIAGDLVDMNPRRFAVGDIRPEEVVGKLQRETPSKIIDVRGPVAGGVYSTDYWWTQTEIRDFVYENYQPTTFMYNQDTQMLAIVWSIPDNLNSYDYAFEEKPGIFETLFLFYDGQQLSAQRINRASSQGDAYFSEGFVDALTSINPQAIQPAAKGAWEGGFKPNSHWKVEDGMYETESWVVPVDDDAFFVYAETRVRGRPTEFIYAQFSREAGNWVDLQIYQKTASSYERVYAESFIKPVE
ncbi:MAG: glycosyltransferase family 39 protein, partial [archaeon]